MLTHRYLDCSIGVGKVQPNKRVELTTLKFALTQKKRVYSELFTSVRVIISSHLRPPPGMLERTRALCALRMLQVRSHLLIMVAPLASTLSVVDRVL